MTKYLLAAALVIAAVGYAIVDQFYFMDRAGADCCANGFDSAPYEQEPTP